VKGLRESHHVVGRVILEEMGASGGMAVRKVTVAVLVFLVTLPMAALLWSALISAIGGVTDSGALGSCGPYGRLGRVLLVLVLAGIVVVPSAAALLTYRLVHRVYPRAQGDSSP
jgi:hypothetical protein